jgi:hypothetical protein
MDPDGALLMACWAGLTVFLLVWELGLGWIDRAPR